eukprot:329669_1
MEPSLNIVELFMGCNYDIIYKIFIFVINFILGLTSLSMIGAHTVTCVCPRDYRNLLIYFLRIIILFVSCMAAVGVCLYIKGDEQNTAWLVHYGLLFVMAVLLAAHNEKCCCYLGEYERIQNNSRVEN